MIYVMSDIHGNKDAFENILQQINFSENDQLFILGDVVDRKKHGVELLQKIMGMHNVYMLLGNHEYMMMDALGFGYEPDGCTKYTTREEKRKQWFMNGGNVTYREWMKLPVEEKKKLRKYLSDLPLKYDIEVNGRKFKLVHAVPCELYDLVEDKLMGQSRAFFSVWERDLIHAFADIDAFTTIFGHTPTCHLHKTNDIMKIYYKGNIIGIDCGAAYQSEKIPVARLACLRLDDMTEFYSN